MSDMPNINSALPLSNAMISVIPIDKPLSVRIDGGQGMEERIFRRSFIIQENCRDFNRNFLFSRRIYKEIAFCENISALCGKK